MGIKPILSLAMTILSLESGPEGPRVRGSPPATVAEVAADGPLTSITRPANATPPALGQFASPYFVASAVAALDEARSRSPEYSYPLASPTAAARQARSRSPG